MEVLFGLLFFAAIVWLLVLPVVVLLNAGRVRRLQETVQQLTARIAALEGRSKTPAAPATAPVHGTPPVEVPPAPVIGEPPAPAPPPTVIPPPLPQIVRPAAVPPPLPSKPARRAAAIQHLDWENLLGVKLFAWVGGFALFLGVVFLVQYSFANNLITPAMRVVMGLVIGLALIAAGWWSSRRGPSIPGQSLCATGVLVLYAAAYAAHHLYGLVSLTTAFLLMSTTTVAAFALAVALSAQAVVVLGLLGGFVTPVLFQGGANPLLLFGYVALLNFGVAAVVLRKGWHYLIALAALCTVLMQWLWAPMDDAGQASAGYWVLLGLQAQFLAFVYLRQERWAAIGAALTGFSSVLYALFLLNFPSLALQPLFFFSFLFLADIGLLALALRLTNPSRIAAPAGVAVFVVLAAWNGWFLQASVLGWALGAYLFFAVLHAGFTIWPPREEEHTGTRRWEVYVPLLALVLLFFTVGSEQTTFAVWFVVLLVNVIALGLAWRTRSIAALVFAIVATLLTAGLWIFTAPPVTDSVLGLLIVIGGFGVFFATASTLLTRQLGIGSAQAQRNVPAIAAAMPFLLLIMLVAKLPVPDPMLLFAVALLLGIVLLGLGIVARTSWIALVALAFTWALERTWHNLHFADAVPQLAIGWYVVFLLLFTAYPFFAREEKSAVPWAIGALSGVLHFWLVYDAAEVLHPMWRSGLLPAVFVPLYAFGVWQLLVRRNVVPASGDARLAWQGGAALLFISLVFPLQFQREWITLGWAVEGLALLALFRYVPNDGLRIVGAALLTIAFIRLALNPAVLDYHPRTATRIWNWYLYAYGLTSVCLIAGASVVQPFRDSAWARAVPRLLFTLGGVLAFLLLNIQIADYFSPGPTLTFALTGNFARDMTYSIAWALFAFVLLLIGMRSDTKVVRYCGVLLLFVTLGKLFLFDLANLGQLYRIGAFIGVALVLIVASFFYQRFLAPTAKEAD
jgi:uncharacterized membrane protein